MDEEDLFGNEEDDDDQDSGVDRAAPFEGGTTGLSPEPAAENFDQGPMDEDVQGAEGGIQQEQDEDEEDLFGDSGDEEPAIVTEPPIEPTRKTVKRYTPSGRSKFLQTTLLPAPPSHSDLFLVNVPSVIGFEPRCFDENEYVPPTSRRKTTWVRWRVGQDAESEEYVKESNTKIVTWSDGSQSLVIGKEVFDIVEHPQQRGAFLFGHYYIDGSGDSEVEGDPGSRKFVQMKLAQCQGRVTKRWAVMSSIESQKRAARNINLQHVQKDKTKLLTAQAKSRKARNDARKTMDRQRLRRRQREAQEVRPARRANLTEQYLEDGDSNESSGAEQNLKALLSAKRDNW